MTVLPFPNTRATEAERLWQRAEILTDLIFLASTMPRSTKLARIMARAARDLANTSTRLEELS